VIAIGGELVSIGAAGLVSTVGLSAGLVGMVITPAAIEAEEIIRQVVPARRGYADVSAGNAVGTVLYFALFNFGLIALLTPVTVPDRVRVFDWPFLVLASAISAAFLLRGRVGRAEGKWYFPPASPILTPAVDAAPADPASISSPATAPTAPKLTDRRRPMA
jgi:cation:H+ antiporter